MQRKKRHHFLPRFYLKGFTDTDSDFLWVYGKGDEEIRRQNYENVAFQNHYYSIELPDGSKESEVFENALSHGESIVAPIFRKIKKHGIIADGEKKMMSSFLAVMMTRVPNFRENIENAVASLKEKLLRMRIAYEGGIEKMMKEYEQGTGNRVNFSAKEMNEFVNSKGWSIKRRPYDSLLRILDSESYAPFFYGLKWIFVIASTDFKFITGDNPLFYMDPDHRADSFYGVGLSNPGIEVTFPISNEVMLFASHKNAGEGFINGSNALIRSLNRRTVIAAHRHVYFYKRDEGIDKLVKKYKDTRPTLIIS